MGSAVGQAVWFHGIYSGLHHAAGLAAVDLAGEEFVDTPVDGSDEHLDHSMGIFALISTQPRSLADCPDCFALVPAHIVLRSYYPDHYYNLLDDHQCCRWKMSAWA